MKIIVPTLVLTNWVQYHFAHDLVKKKKNTNASSPEYHLRSNAANDCPETSLSCLIIAYFSGSKDGHQLSRNSALFLKFQDCYRESDQDQARVETNVNTIMNPIII